MPFCEKLRKAEVFGKQKSMKILLVEDDERILEFLQRGLQAEGYHVDVARDGMTGLETARTGRYNLIVLDLMLPKLDGRDLCRILRTERVQVPIMMLTALDSTEDIVSGQRSAFRCRRLHYQTFCF